MGIFHSRPEQPDEWGGLPVEPGEPRAAAELLPPPAPVLGILGGDAVAISVSVDASLYDTPPVTDAKK